MTDAATASIPWFRTVDRGAWRALLAARFRARTSQPRQHRASVIRSDRYRCRALIPIRARSRPIPVPPHVRPGPFSANANGATSGAVLSDAIGVASVGSLVTL
jgi:hypothetical protein